jgi:c-di-GMP-binding flagellar brake protein YcgR
MDELDRLTSRSIGSERQHEDRRGGERVPLQLLVNEYVGERLQRGYVSDVSPTGLYLDRVFGASHDRLQLGRDERMVQLEFELPATNESIWALAEIRHDRVGTPRGERTMVHGTGMRFTAMARKHERLISDFVFEERRRGLARLLERITNRRRRDRRRNHRRSVAA